MTRNGIKVGAGFLGHLSRDVTVQKLVSAAKACEAAGLDSFWVADQRFMRDVFVSLTAIAMQTDRILLGTRVTDPYVRHPALTAVAIATLDEASGGRAILGLGAGGSGFTQIGIRRDRPALALREAIQLMRRLWSGDELEYHGQLVHWEHGGMQFPIRPGVPIVIAARGPRILELAGEVADGAIIAAGTSQESVAWARERISAGEKRAGRPAGSCELLHMTYLAIDSDPSAARTAAKRAIVGAVVGSHPTYEFLKANGLEVPPVLFRYLDNGGRDAGRIAGMIPDEFVSRLTVAGDSRACLEQLERLIEYGIQHPLLTPVSVHEGGELTVLQEALRNIVPTLKAASRMGAVTTSSP